MTGNVGFGSLRNSVQLPCRYKIGHDVTLQA